MARAYSVTLPATSIASAISLIQIKAGSTSGLTILRAQVSQSNVSVSSMVGIEIVRKTAAATVTSATPTPLLTNDAAAQAVGGTAATGYNATVEGTDGLALLVDSFNVLNGWLYLPVPEERILVPPSGIIAVKFLTTPATANWQGTVIFQELE